MGQGFESCPEGKHGKKKPGKPELEQEEELEEETRNKNDIEGTELVKNVPENARKVSGKDECVEETPVKPQRSTKSFSSVSVS